MGVYALPPLRWPLETTSRQEFDVFIFLFLFWIILQQWGDVLEGRACWCCALTDVEMGAELSSRGAEL